MFLPGEFFESARAHAIGQRTSAVGSVSGDRDRAEESHEKFELPALGY
jgi:hypothetical protein